MPRAARRERSPPAHSDAATVADPTAGRWNLGAAQLPTDTRLTGWTDDDAVSRIWRKDPAFWPQAPPSEVGSRLGWLRAPEQSAARVAELDEFARRTVEDGFEHVVLFGMGGSSLAPEVIARILPRAKGRPDLSVLDSTHPEAVRACAERTRLETTLFLVSSKSGTTLEPNAFFRFFWARVGKRSGTPGRHFVAITDPGTPLEGLAHDRKFRSCFLAPPDVGGRYSALTVFGLVPAALVGADLAGLLGSARAMVARCADPADPVKNPGLRLGAALAELARLGRDKVVFLPSRSLLAFPAWAEQLIAESLGKLGRGIVPVADPPQNGEFPRGSDAVYVPVSLKGERDPRVEEELDRHEAGDAPVLRFDLPSPLDLGREFFRWEFAVAAAGAVLGVDPFDQPDVEHAKELARAAMDRPGGSAEASGAYGTTVDARLDAPLQQWLTSVRPGDYASVQAFLAPSEAADAGLAKVASSLRRHLGTVVTVGYGPRFLHSTGQLHKGGPPSGRFLQLVDDPEADLEVPELDLTFGEIIRAQARGDRAALEEKHRSVLVVNVGRSPSGGLDRLAEALARSPTAPPEHG
jgi:transaldolase / glucose-6-phosphate isomerase